MKIPIVHLQVVRDRQADYCSGSISSPGKAAEWMKKILGNASREQVVVCCMDGRMEPAHIDIAGVGGSTGCPCPIPEIFRTALVTNASSVMLFHNHPSGDASPSGQDIALTEKLRAAGELLQMPVKDHIILGDGEYYSFHEEGML